MNQSYQVRFGPQRITPGVKGLIIANAAVFVLQSALDMAGYGRFFTGVFGLFPPLVVKRFFVWQPATYMFLHGGLFHILWNMLMLWMFGVDVESRMGTRRFLIYYFFCGVGAGLTGLVFPPAWQAVTVGASGAIFGIYVAAAVFFPDAVILIFFLFPMKLKHAVILFAVIQMYSVMGGGAHNVAYFAHLGGLLFGILYFQAAPRLNRSARHIDSLRRNAEARRNEDEEKEVDRILEKITREGIQSLSSRERAFLKNRSERRAGR